MVPLLILWLAKDLPCAYVFVSARRRRSSVGRACDSRHKGRGIETAAELGKKKSSK